MKSQKMTMAWALFIVWTITIICTFAFNKDVATLSIVSGVFGWAVTWLFKLRNEGKVNGTEPTNGQS